MRHHAKDVGVAVLCDDAGGALVEPCRIGIVDAGHLSPLALPLIRPQRLAERLKQFAVHRIALRIVLGMPLHAERKARRIRDADRLDGAVLGGPLDDHALAWLENTLSMQRIDPDGLAAEQRCKSAAAN